MSIRNTIAQYHAWRQGVVHTTLNPEGPGAVRIHLIPPRWRLFGHRCYVVILNGYYILPLGYSWAILLKNFILEVDAYAGKPMTETDMQQVVERAVRLTRRTYYDISEQALTHDLGEILQVLFCIAQGKTPESEIGTLSLREYAPQMSAPHRMDLMLSAMTDSSGSWNCNLKCRHCYAAGQPGAALPELTTNQWKQIINRLREAGVPQLTFTGGEPTLREDLAELIDHAKWFVTRLNTNGVLLTPQLCAALRQASLDSLQITLYSSDAAVHNALVGAGEQGVTGSWEKTIQGLRNALAAGLDVSVNTPICRDNAHYLQTLRFLQAEGVRYVSCSGLIETGRAAKQPSLQARLEQNFLSDILREAAAFCAQTGMELSFTSPGQVEPALLQALKLAVPMCGACLSNMAIAPDGSVMPCQSWLGEAAPLGNLLRQNWRSIWQHPTCRKIRNMQQDEALHCPLRVAGATKEVAV